ncbi:MAG: gamma-glutamyltransferase [Pseudomonadota bacterium]
MNLRRIIFLFLICFGIFIVLYSPSALVHAQDKPHTHYWNEPEDYRASPEPETGGAKGYKKRVQSDDYMIVTANPYATRAGNYILEKGGSAVDAAIAAQLVLTLVEPQSSGIGGGGFLLHWDAKRKKISSYDGRETAPASFHEKTFLDDKGQPRGFQDLVQSGLAIGVPGVVKLMEDVHRQHGKLPWKELFQPAIELAYNGFYVSPRLHNMLSRKPVEQFHPIARQYFYSNGKAAQVGLRQRNQSLSRIFTTLANKGAHAFYHGDIAKMIVQRVKEISNDKNGMRLEDLMRYRVIKREPLCVSYRRYKICSMGPPSSGGVAIAQTLKLVEPYDMGLVPLNSKALHIISEAQKLSYADRKRYLADHDFVKVPVPGLLDQKYIDKRRRLIDLDETMTKALPGQPDFKKQSSFGIDATQERPGTTHLSVIDKDGNAVSMTSSVETAFGSKVLVNGFLLNSQLTDFSRKPVDENGTLIANRIAPGKRPRSTMAPTLIFDENHNLEAVLGSPGGSRIILYILKSIIALIDWKLDAQMAASLANFGSRNGPFEIEKDQLPPKALDDLRAKGHQIKMIPMVSGMHLILKQHGMLFSGIDPSREGAAMGR